MVSRKPARKAPDCQSNFFEAPGESVNFATPPALTTLWFRSNTDGHADSREGSAEINWGNAKYVRKEPRLRGRSHHGSARGPGRAGGQRCYLQRPHWLQR